MRAVYLRAEISPFGVVKEQKQADTLIIKKYEDFYSHTHLPYISIHLRTTGLL